ncbi:HAD domain-containing protein [Streptacidiphilus sp. N1-3]|uniref:HAD domain-containing protein n=1 Tax=Streptacidiphilus alkalitolerans TaxID=3342712 RepID=A0ABV6X602_9ACTN
MLRPLLFLDVDGPLLPFGAPEGHPTYPSGQGSAADANPLLARLNPALGPRLAALPCELVWATSWMADANECIAPRLGLPDLPVVTWPDPSPQDAGLHWKTPGLLRWAAGRPFCWVDDEITDPDRAWVSRHHGGRSLLHRVDPRRGLTDADFSVITDWMPRSR